MVNVFDWIVLRCYVYVSLILFVFIFDNFMYVLYFFCIIFICISLFKVFFVEFIIIVD